MLVKNLQRRPNFVAERDFPIQNSYTDQVQRLSHSRDQKNNICDVISAKRYSRLNFGWTIRLTLSICFSVNFDGF